MTVHDTTVNEPTASARDLARSLLARSGPATVPLPITQPPAVQPPVAVGRDQSISDHPGVQAARRRRALLDGELARRGMPDPYFVPHTGVNGASITLFDRQMINFSGFNYLGLAGDPRVVEAAKTALDDYGTTCSASRIVSGQIPLHARLERRLAESLDVEDAVVTGSGYLTNAAAIGFVLGAGDLAVCDALVHNSILAGTQWAQCWRMSFRHNDPEALDALLRRSRGHFQRAMVILEGVYSMDGDIAALPELVEVAHRHGCLVMVDEAHSFGVLGDTGLGVREHYGMAGADVDLWMGTLSKSLASYGGYLAGSAELVDALRVVAPGISLYSTAPPPAAMGAALAALDVLAAEPERARRVCANGEQLAGALRAAGVDVGTSSGTPVVPALTGGTRRTMLAAQALLAEGVNANPIMHPAVPEGEGRVRFFVNTEHTGVQIELAARVLGDFLARETDT